MKTTIDGKWLAVMFVSAALNIAIAQAYGLKDSWPVILGYIVGSSSNDFYNTFCKNS